MIERVMVEADHRPGEGGADLGPEDARTLLRSWLAAVELEGTDGELIARMQADDFSHEDLFRHARRQHERKLAAAVESGRVTADLFDACVAAIPYIPSAAFLGRERTRLTARDYEPVRVALVVDGDAPAAEEIREHGVPGSTVEVIGTGANVDRRIAAPSVPAVVDALTNGRYDVVRVCSSGPTGAIAALVARAMELPVVDDGDAPSRAA
jgi:hypothetical protein